MATVRKRWLRRVLFGAAALLVVGAVALWFALPSIITSQATKAALRLGFDEATIEVERADLFALHVASLHLRKGGLQASLARAEADYSITGLLGGKVGAVRLRGLELVLDFTQPRTAILPDAITELLAQLPQSDDPLVWPVGTLRFDDCRVVLVLPEGAETFSLDGQATKRSDGFVSFTLASNHPRQELRVSGAVRTETFDGEIEVQRLQLSPPFLLGLLRRLGAYELPADVRIDSDDLEASGHLTLQAGAPASFRGSVRGSRVAADFGGTGISLDQPTIDGARGDDDNLTATLRGVLTASDADANWGAGPAAVEISLDHGQLRATLAAAAAHWQEDAAGRVALDVTCGLPALGGQPHATVTLTANDARYGRTTLAPFTLMANGWLDRVQVTVPELKLADEVPASLREISATVVDPFGAARELTLAATVVARNALASLLPAGWQLMEPQLPADALRLTTRVTWSETGPAGETTFEARIPRVKLETEGRTFSSASTLDLSATIDASGVEASASIALSEIETDLPKFIPGVKAMSFGVEVPRVSFAALAELAAGRVPRDDVALKLQGSVAQSEAKGYAYLDVRHFGASSDWTAEAWAMLDDLNGTWAGTNLAGTRVELTVNSGRMPDTRVGEWLAARELTPLLRAILPLVRFDLTVTANSIEFPQQARADWSGLWINKPPATDDGPPIAATITAYSGLIHAGPESIEQPSIKIDLSGDFEALTVKTEVRGTIEGSPLTLIDTEKLRIDLADFSVAGEGAFELQPFTLKQSDLVSRWAPAAKGIVIGATASATGTLAWHSSGRWDGTARIQLSDGLFDYPDQKLRAEGIFTDVTLTSLQSIRTLQNQPLGFARLVLGDVEVTNGMFHFATDGLNRVAFDSATARIFGGDIAVGSFALEFPAPDVGINLEFEGLDAGQLVQQLKIFQGSLTGRLRGKLPLGLLAGRPVVGEGYLELDPRVPSIFSMDARGLLTTDVPNRTMIDKLSRLPYELAEEALANVAIKTLRIDLFPKNRPDTPIRLEFSGESVTRRARVPVHIITNVNGSLSQVLNFLKDLAQL